MVNMRKIKIHYFLNQILPVGVCSQADYLCATESRGVLND
jgi:hypothetical protein